MNNSKLLSDQPQQLATLLQVNQRTMSLVRLQFGIVHHPHHAPKPEDNKKEICQTSRKNLMFEKVFLYLFGVQDVGLFLKDAHSNGKENDLEMIM